MVAPAKLLRVSADLSLPLDTVTSTLVVYGGKGMGKSNFAAVLAEELKAARRRFAVVDPVGVWWGLQYSADGKSPGLEVLVLGGVHGDLPIEATAGAVVADLVVDEDVDVVIDISRQGSGKMWSRGEQLRFVADYCTRLFERQGERMRPLLQMFDEAGRFVPEQIPAGAIDIAKCVGAIEQLVELGRNVGVGMVLITQRSARMKKSVSELADAVVAFRTVGPRSIDAILDWFGEHVPRDEWKRLLEQLRTLPVGTALVVSPGWLAVERAVRMRPRRTFDSSATPTESGRRTSGPAAKPNLAKYRSRMAEVVERAQAADPRELRRRIAELEEQLRTAPQVRQVERFVEVPVLAAEDLHAIEAGLMALQAVADGLTVAAGQIAGALGRLPAEKPADGPQKGISGQFEKRGPEPAVPENGQPLARPQRAILAALAEFEAMGLQQVARGNLAVFSGQSPNSSAYRNNLGKLSGLGLLRYPRSGMVCLTDAGRKIAAPSRRIGSVQELHVAWYGKLSGSQGRILQALIERYPSDISREDLSQLAEQSATSSAYRNNLGRLSGLGLLRYPSAGRVVATELLFPDSAAPARSG